jgi:hypothetical protein
MIRESSKESELQGFGIRNGSLLTPPTDARSNLDWLVNEQRAAPYIPVFDKSKHDEGTFSREDFTA